MVTMNPNQIQDDEERRSPQHVSVSRMVKAVEERQRSEPPPPQSVIPESSTATTATDTTNENNNISKVSHHSTDSSYSSSEFDSEEEDEDDYYNEDADEFDGYNDEMSEIDTDSSHSYILEMPDKPDSVSTLGNMTYMTEMSDHTLKETSRHTDDFYSTHYDIVEDDEEEEESTEHERNMQSIEETLDSSDDDEEESIEIEVGDSSHRTENDKGSQQQEQERQSQSPTASFAEVSLDSNEMEGNELDQSIEFNDIDKVVETTSNHDQVPLNDQGSVDWGDSFDNLAMDDSQVFEDVRRSTASFGGSFEESLASLGSMDTARRGAVKAAAIAQAAAFWGRDEELDTLQRAFASMTTRNASSTPITSSPTPTIFWISGNDPGIGKTRLASEFIQRLPGNPIICRGSFTENYNERSFNGVVSCYSEMLDVLLQPENIQEWRTRIRDCLGRDLDLLALHIPSLAILFEEEDQTRRHTLEKDDEKNRFERLKGALCQLLSTVCQHKDVVFVVDNLQWADDGSVKLIESLLTRKKSQRFFFLGCHRRLKVSHPMTRMKSRLPTERMTDVRLPNLDPQAAKSILAYHLRSFEKEQGGSLQLSLPNSLSPLWEAESSTNPLYIAQLVDHLHDKKTLRFESRSWVLDRDYSLPSSPTILMTERFGDLADDQRLVLKSAALLGSDLFTVKLVCVAIRTLAKFEKSDAVITPEETQSILGLLAKKEFLRNMDREHFHFVDNILREVVLSNIGGTAKRRKRLRARLALNLMKSQSADEAEPDAVEQININRLVAHHFCEGYASLTKEQEKLKAAKLTFQVAEHCAVKAAFGEGARILQTSMATLDKKTQWKDSYQLTLKIHLALGRCLFHNGDPDKAKLFANIIIANGRVPRDKVGGFDLLSSICRSKGQNDLSKNVILKALKEIWGDDPNSTPVEQKLTQVRALARAKSDTDMLIIDDMTHRKTLAKMPFLMKLVEVCVVCQDFRLQDLAVMRIVELTMQHGSFGPSYTGLAFALFGICLGRRRLHGEAYRYGLLADMMSSSENCYGRQAITIFHNNLRFWKAPIQDSPKSLHEVCKQSLKTSDMGHVSLQVEAYLATTFIAGQSLDIDKSVVDEHMERCGDPAMRNSWKAIVPYNTIMRLTGDKERNDNGCLSDTKAMQYDLFHQMVTAVYFQDMEGAAQLCAKLLTRPDGVWIPFGAFMEGIVAAHLTRTTTGKEKIANQKKALNLMNLLSIWTSKGVQCVGVMSEVLKAEVTIATELNVTPQKASVLFENGIQSASTVPAVAALACERAGLYYISESDDKTASRFLARSCQFYEKWGAIAKVKQLNDEYQKYLQADPESPPTSVKQFSSKSLLSSCSNSEAGNNPWAKFMTGSSERGFSDMSSTAVRPDSLRGQFQRGSSESALTSSSNFFPRQGSDRSLVTSTPAMPMGMAQLQQQYVIPGYAQGTQMPPDRRMSMSNQGLQAPAGRKLSMPGVVPGQHQAGLPQGYNQMNPQYQPGMVFQPPQPPFTNRPQQYPMGVHPQQAQQQYPFGPQMQQPQQFYPPYGHPQQPQQQFQYFQQQATNGMYQHQQMPPQRGPQGYSQRYFPGQPNKNTQAVPEANQHPEQAGVSADDSKKAKKSAKAQTRSNSKDADKEDAKPRKVKSLSTIGQTMTELTSDLSLREFLKDFNIGTKKTNGSTVQKALTTSEDVPESQSTRKPRPSFTSLKSWTTRSWTGGLKANAEAETEEAQPRRRLKGQKANVESNSNETPPVSPVSKKASLKVDGPPKSPKKKKKSVVKKAALVNSKADSKTAPPSPKKKKSVVKPALTDSKKAVKKKSTKAKADAKDKAVSTDEETSTNSLTKAKKKKEGPKKKIQEKQGSVAEAPKVDKGTKKKKKANSTKKTKKASEESE